MATKYHNFYASCIKMETIVLMLAMFCMRSKAVTPIFTTPGFSGRTVPVSETLPAGTSVYKVVAVDADGDVLVYSLTAQLPTHPQKFSINSKTGTVSTLTTFDVDIPEAVKLFEISIRVTDGTSNILTTLIMEVIDENDNSPVFSHYHVIRQNTKPGFVIADIRAEDADSDRNGLVTYKITGGNEDNAFGIDAGIGVLYTMYKLDPGSRDLYNLVIEARDSAATPRSSTMTMTLTLIGGLDNGAADIRQQVFIVTVFFVLLIRVILH